MNQGSIIELKDNLKDLRLSVMYREIDTHIRQAKESGINYDEFLLELTRIEIESRSANRLKRRIKDAKFPLIKPLPSPETVVKLHV